MTPCEEETPYLYKNRNCLPLFPDHMTEKGKKKDGVNLGKRVDRVSDNYLFLLIPSSIIMSSSAQRIKVILTSVHIYIVKTIVFYSW